MNRWKCRSKGLLKAIFFCHQKSRETLHEIFFSLQYLQCLYNHFPPIPPIFWCPLFSENYLNSEVRINKMVNKHTFDYHPSPSQLTLRIYPLIFLWTPKGFISPESFLNFPPCIFHHGCGKVSNKRKLPIPPEQRFLKIYFSPAERGRELWTWKNYQN